MLGLHEGAAGGDRERLRDRHGRARVRAGAHHRRVRQRRVRAGDRARQPRAAGGAGRPAGPPPPAPRSRSWRGGCDGLAGDYPVWIDQPARAQDVPGSLARAWNEARTARGPALVVVPMDDWLAPAGEQHEIAAPQRADGRARGGAGADRRAGRPARAGAARRRWWSAPAPTTRTPGPRWSRSPSGSACPVWQEASARAPASRRTTRASPATCPPAGAACARRWPGTTSCWPWARRCSGSTPTSPARWSRRARAWRW